MKKIISFIIVIAIILSAVSCSPAKSDTQLKYVFLFIGDGMSFNAVQLARDAKAARQGKTVPSELSFTDFDAVGLFTNYDKTSFIPDSASSGTAMATGKKTESGMVSYLPSSSKPDSIATVLKREYGMKVGIITTANLNHATPSVFYAHSKSRYNYYEIGTYIADSGFDLFIGGRFFDEDGGDENLVTLAENGGYTVIDSHDEILDIKDKNKKYIIFDPYCDNTGMMSFAIDRAKKSPSLADYVRLGIDLLDNENGFFMMCEGGRIDSALHANDASTALMETLAFSDAVNEALDFYEKHPEETLILVTGDHETGGLSLGYTGMQYDTAFDTLFDQKLSFYSYQEEYISKYISQKASIDDIINDLDALFGLSRERLTDYDIQRLEYAWEKTLDGVDSYTEEDGLRYYTRSPLAVQVTQLVANKAGIGFSSFVHTASLMPLWAKGVGEEVFVGTYDNTDVYNKIYNLFFK